MVVRVHVKKNLLGGYTVSYDCPQCSAKLKSPIDDAGKSDTCPQCGRQFIVPGGADRDRIRNAEATATEYKRKAQEQQLRQKKQHRDAAIRPTASDVKPEFKAEPELPTVFDTRRCPYCGEVVLAIA